MLLKLASALQIIEKVALTHVEKPMAVDNVEYTAFSDVCYICHDEGEDHEMLVCD